MYVCQRQVCPPRLPSSSSGSSFSPTSLSPCLSRVGRRTFLPPTDGVSRDSVSTRFVLLCCPSYLTTKGPGTQELLLQATRDPTRRGEVWRTGLAPRTSLSDTGSSCVGSRWTRCRFCGSNRWLGFGSSYCTTRGRSSSRSSYGRSTLVTPQVPLSQGWRSGSRPTLVRGEVPDT